MAQLGGEAILAEIEKLNESEYRELEQAFAFMRERGLLPDVTPEYYLQWDTQ